MSRARQGCALVLFGCSLGLVGLSVAAWQLWAGVPGTASKELEHLNPAFRTRVEAVLTELEDAGYEPTVRETWRDLDRQAYYKDQGWSKTSFGFHNTMGSESEPDALAIDLGHAGLSAKKSADIPALAQFYLALRDAASGHGLTTGGTWRRSNQTWAAHDLGWDPGHVQPKGLSIAAARRGERP